MSFRILVTGASGFIGSALVPSLAAAGHYVRAASRNPSSAVAGGGIECVGLPDLTGGINWDVLLAGIDIVVHLAGIAHRQRHEIVDYDKVNREVTDGLAQACLRHRVKRLIFLSSIAAQTGSAADHILTEADEPRPLTAYGHSKLAAEVAIQQCGVPFTILRPVIVYGPRAAANIRLMTRIAASPWPLPFGAFRNRRSLVAIDNLIQAIAHCLDSPATLDQIFIVADSEPISLVDMLTVMREATGRSPRLVSVLPSAVKGLIMIARRGALWDRIGRELVVSTAKLQNTGWRPQTGTKEGLRAMMEVISLRSPDFSRSR
jgi:nucleoside-diphosphate-sugar epimerase